jgi:hypothetical protein
VSSSHDIIHLFDKVLRQELLLLDIVKLKEWVGLALNRVVKL